MTSGQLGEARVFQILKESLPDDWVVIHDCWRYYLDAKKYTNYEMDFIVLVPEKGFVVIEVKTWYEAKVEEGRWYFLGPEGKWEAMEHKMSPLHQAYLAAKKLNGELSHVTRFSRWYYNKESKSRIAYHALAVLLRQSSEIVPLAASVEKDVEVERKNAVPLEQLYICGEDNLRDNLQGKIEDLFSRNVPPYFHPLKPHHIREIVNYLLPSFHLRGNPEDYNRIMEDAAISLHSVLPMLENSEQGISVTGCAGTGKTWMATREMARLYEKYGSPKKILFLCFNQALAEHVRHLPDLADGIGCGAIDVYTFPALCKKIINRDIEGKQAQQEWFRSLQAGDLKGVLLEVQQKLSVQPEFRYDFIFIDECQDFHENWGGVISMLQGQGAKLYYFSDSNQNIFMEKGSPYLPKVPTRLTLRRNLRNSTEIARYSAALLDGQAQMESLHVPGFKVQIANAEVSEQERARLVSRWIDILIRGKADAAKRNEKENNWCAARPHQIVVLSPYSPNPEGTPGKEVRPECSLPYISRITCHREGLSTGELLVQREHDESLIVGTTIRSFKGLESDYIILTDVDVPGSDRAQSKNDFFVACTRARYGLIIIPKSSDGEAYARELLTKSQESRAGMSS